MALVEVELERVAHGGSVVGRTGDKVVFVHGGLPGELVRAEITETSKRFDRGRVVEVLRAAPGRVTPPCPVAGECGGCDWQHASLETQLDLKTAVVAEQLQRLAGIEWTGRVESVGPAEHSRTRMRYSIDDSGRVGLKGRRSHEVVPLPEQGCMVAAPGPSVGELNSVGARTELQVINADGNLTVVVDKRVASGPDPVVQEVDSRPYEVSATGFWQVHPRAAEVLTSAVVEGIAPRAGESALDLYCGVGLFAGFLADAGCDVLGVELNPGAIHRARKNVPGARFIAAPMEKALGRLPEHVDVVVLDPPRKGAGEKVVQRLAALGARAIAYVACDPAALARDLAYFETSGYAPTSIRAWDLFPMTHHVECVAMLHPIN